MLKRLSQAFTPPVFPEDEDKTRKAKYANVIAIAFFAIAFGFEAFLRLFANYTKLSILDLASGVLIAICVIGLVLLRRGYVRLTSVLLVLLVWLTANGLAAAGYGAKDSSYILNFAVILMAGLLLSWQASLVITILSVFSGFALAYAEQNGRIGVPLYPTMSFARDIAFVFAINFVLILLLITGLENALRKSRMDLKELEEANSKLNYTQNELQNRGAELTVANKQLEN